MLAGAFLAVQGQQLAEPALGGGGGLLGEQRKKQQAQSIIVGAVINSIFAAVFALADRQNLLRRHGGGGADTGTGAIAVLALERAKIGQLEQRAPFADQDVAEFQIAIHETGTVDHIQTIQDLFGPIENLGQIRRWSVVPPQL